MTRARPLLSWGALSAALLGVMLAKWAWLLLAPDGAALPPAAWEPSDDAGRVFGAAAAATAAPIAGSINFKLIGVFANRTKGFAIMQVDDKQIGVAQGDDVKPGVRLAETHPDYVVLDQGGVRTRVMLSAASASPPTVSPPAASPPAAGTAPGAQASVTPGPARQPMPVPGANPVTRRIQSLQRKLAANPGMSPAQRKALQSQINNAMRGHR